MRLAGPAVLAVFPALFAAFSPSAAGAQVVVVEDAFLGLRFDRPVALDAAPGQADRAYVVEQGGRVRTALFGASAAETFLDIRDRVDSGPTEAGLLGLAFHPDYAANGRFFVNYTAPGDGRGVLVTRVSEFARSVDDPLRADAASERVLLEVGQPFENHNAGALAFGPDGLLYIALGDGGGEGDPEGNGQNAATLLGSILRIDVDDAPEGAAYGIPDANPFALTDGPERDEIFAYGFRNPYKISVEADGTVWAGDVGQGRWEEIDRVVAGGNYGWNEVEGRECFPAGSDCDLGAFTPPVFAYPHADGNRSVTGGVGTEGTPLAAFGDYVYGDFVSGRLWALDTTAMPVRSTALVDPSGEPISGGLISSIDRGPDGDVYVADYRGTVGRLRVQGGTATAPPATGGAALRLAGPNPFRAGTRVEIGAPVGDPLRVSVVDVLGREVAQLWDGPTPPGVLRLALDGAALAPGVYTVRLASGAGRAALRVVHVR